MILIDPVEVYPTFERRTSVLHNGTEFPVPDWYNGSDVNAI